MDNSLRYILYAVAILLIIYTIYVYTADEHFSNNSSIRSDPGGDKNFEQLSLEDQVNYIKDKQVENLNSMA